MNGYTQLTIEQRYQIDGMTKEGFSQTEISGELKVHKSTISRELKRNIGQRSWRPKQAQDNATARRLACKNVLKFSAQDWSQVDVLLRTKLSPAKVSGRMALEKTLCISV